MVSKRGDEKYGQQPHGSGDEYGKKVLTVRNKRGSWFRRK
jgi:hypothetical protein